MAPDSSPYRLSNVRAAIGHYLFGRGASAACGLATVILLARVMDVTAYAGYIALTGLSGIAAMLSSLGLERAITRLVPEGRLFHSEDKLQIFVWKVLFARLAATLFVTELLAAAWPRLVALFDFVNLDRMPWALAILLVASSLFEVLATVLQALVQQKLLTRIMVLIWGGRLVAILYMVHLQRGLDLEQVLWLMGIPEFAGAVALLVATQVALRHNSATTRHGEPPEAAPWPQWQEVRSIAGHAYVFNMLASVPQGYFMRALVAAMLPVEIVAAYGFFSNLVDKIRSYLPIQLMYNLFEPVLVAQYLENMDEHALSRQIVLMYKANLLIIMMSLVFLAVSGQAAVGLATGRKFLEQTWILPLLLVQIALGSHVLAIQLVVNVLKCNHILSQAGTVALAVMLCFIGIVHFSGRPLLMLCATLIYSITVNAFAMWRLTRSHVIYRPPLRGAFMLVAISLPVVATARWAVTGFRIESHVVLISLLGGAAVMALALLSLLLRYAGEEEIGLLTSVAKSKWNVRL